MRIRSIHIDAFGRLRDLTISGLPAGMTIFLGPNEAGKTTLLDFVRATLTGYPRTRGLRENSYIQGQGLLGGTLELETALGPLRLTRRPRPLGVAPTLTDAQGAPLDPAVWDTLLNKVSREVYTNLYGFSLTELQTLSSLSLDEVRNTLYGASFGQGLCSPGQALTNLKKSMELLFKPRGSGQRISKALAEWATQNKTLRDTESDVARYEALAEKQQTLTARLKELQATHDTLKTEQRILDRRLHLWAQWEDWRLLGLRLDQLEPVSNTFPEEGVHRLERIQDQLHTAEQQQAQAVRRLEQIQEELCQSTFDERLLEAAPTVRSLSAGISSYRNALASLPPLRAELARTIQEQERLLRALGWTREQALAAKDPLAQRERFERQALLLQQAEQQAQLAETAWARLQQEQATTETACRSLEAKVSDFPLPTLQLTPNERETLRLRMAHVESQEQERPAREQALREARQRLEAVLERLGLSDQPSLGPALDTLAARRAQIQHAAASLREAEAAQSRHTQICDQHRAAQAKQQQQLEALDLQLASLPSQTLRELTAERTAVRNLRQLAARLEAQRERLNEAASQLTSHLGDTPRPERHPALLVLSGLSLSAGTVLGGLKYLRPDLTGLPHDPSTLLLLFAAGCLLLLAGWPKRSPLTDWHTATSRQLENRVSQYRQAVEGTLQEQNGFLHTLHCAETLSETQLEQREQALDTAFEQAHSRTQLALKRTAMAAELDALTARQTEDLAEAARLSQHTEAAEQTWTACFLLPGTALAAPRPEEAATFSSEVETARSLLREYNDQERQSRAAAQALTLLQEELAGLSIPFTAGEAASVLSAGRRALILCTEADRLITSRQQLVEKLEAARQACTDPRFAQAQEAAAARNTDLAEAQQAWQALLQAEQFDPTLSPATASRALDALNQIQQLAAEQARLNNEITRQEQEREALLTPLRALLTTLDRAPATEPSPEDWPTLLETLGQAVDTARAQAVTRHQRQEQLQSQKQEVVQAQALLRNAGEQLARLLQLAGAADSEDFRRLAAIRKEREACLQKREELANRLQLAAADLAKEPPSAALFARFLEGFAQEDKPSLEDRLNTLNTRLAAQEEEQARLTNDLHTTELGLRQVQDSSALALAREEVACTSETVRTLSLDWARLALASHLITEARGRFERERQPDVIRFASTLFAEITGGRWQSISASLEDSSLRILPPSGEPLAPELLSRGTQEQLYLALRLGHMRSLAAQGEPLPLMMDDILVNFDPERAKRTASALASLTQAQNHSAGYQLLFFTCHPHIAELLQQTDETARIYRLESGSLCTNKENRGL